MNFPQNQLRRHGFLFLERRLLNNVRQTSSDLSDTCTHAPYLPELRQSSGRGSLS